jgi:hypothetical protein
VACNNRRLPKELGVPASPPGTICSNFWSLPFEHLTSANRREFCCLASFLYPTPARIGRPGYGISAYAFLHKMLDRFSGTGRTSRRPPAPARSHCDSAGKNIEICPVWVICSCFIKTIAFHNLIRTRSMRRNAKPHNTCHDHCSENPSPCLVHDEPPFYLKYTTRYGSEVGAKVPEAIACFMCQRSMVFRQHPIFQTTSHTSLNTVERKSSQECMPFAMARNKSHENWLQYLHLFCKF